MIRIKVVIICDICAYKRTILGTTNETEVRQIAETFGWKRKQIEEESNDICPVCWGAWKRAYAIHGGE